MRHHYINSSIFNNMFFYFFFIDSKTLIPITFKFSPPKLSQLSVHSSSTSLQDKTLGSSSPGSGPLSEFLPAYSGKSCLKQQRKSSNTKSGSDDGIELQSLSDGQQLSDRPRQCVPRPSEKSKLPLAQEVEVLSPLTKSVSETNRTVTLTIDSR